MVHSGGRYFVTPSRNVRTLKVDRPFTFRICCPSPSNVIVFRNVEVGSEIKNPALAGFIEYNGKLGIHSSLLNVILHD
jgi:hypothetical protein